MRNCGAIFEYDLKRDRLAEVDAELEQPDVWSDPERAQALGKERARLVGIVEPINQAAGGLVDRLDDAHQACAFLAERLRAFGVAPHIGLLKFRIDFGEPVTLQVVLKDSPAVAQSAPAGP